MIADSNLDRLPFLHKRSRPYMIAKAGLFFYQIYGFHQLHNITGILYLNLSACFALVTEDHTLGSEECGRKCFI